MRSLRVVTQLSLAALAVATALPAQTDPASRAAAARAALQRAGASERAGLADSVYADVVRAQAAWPDQPSYTQLLARRAARRSDLVALQRALELLITQSTGIEILRDSSVRARAAGSEAIATRLVQLEASLAPVDRGVERLVASDTAFWPEGIDVDPRDGTLYITSIRHRSLYSIAPGGDVRDLLSTLTPRPMAVMGVAVDVARDFLWITTWRHPAMEAADSLDPRPGELIQLRLHEGTVVRRWYLKEGTAPGEIAVGPDGEVVVTEGIGGRLLRFRPGRSSIDSLSHPLLGSPQGVAFSADGRTAWIADWSHGLLRWDRATDSITAVETGGNTTLVGIDGLRRHGRDLIGVQNGVSPARIVRIELSADGRRLVGFRTLDRPAELRGEMTVGTIVGDDFVYVASSHWPFFRDDGTRAGKEPLPPVILRRVPLTP